MRYTVKVLLEYESIDKARWHTVGRAFDDKDGSGRIVIVFDSLPFRSEYVYLYPEDQKGGAK